MFPEEEVEEIDVAKEWEGLCKVERELVEIDRKIENYLKELRY